MPPIWNINHWRTRQQAARFFREVDHDGARFEHREIIGFPVDDCRYTAIGIDGEVLRTALGARGEIHCMHRIG
jgi:hypothetical protein